jgi:hypothetical protein
MQLSFWRLDAEIWEPEAESSAVAVPPILPPGKRQIIDTQAFACNVLFV